MLFNSGTTSLISYSRDLSGDPASAPSQLFSDQRVKDAINESYLELYDVARQFGVGTGFKRTYATTVADQIFYSLPTDFMKMILVEVSGGGTDLSTSTANSTSLKALSADVALAGYEGGIYDSTQYYYIHNQHVGIIAPPSTGGANSIRLSYEAEVADLVGNANEPDLPKTYHSLICYRAAIVLRETMELSTRGLERIANRKEIRFMRAMHDNVADFEGQAYVAGLNKHNTLTRHGRLVEN
jgi:hypothetical protein